MTIYTKTGDLQSDLTLFGDRVLLNFVDPTVIQKTKKNIYTANAPRESHDEGQMVELHVQTTVAAVGDEVENLIPGLSVIHNIANGIVVRIDDKEYFLTNAINIIAVVTPRVEEPVVPENLRGPFRNAVTLNGPK